MTTSRKFDGNPENRIVEYSSQNESDKQQECSILTIYPSGLRLLFNERPARGSTIFLEIPIPGELTPINLEGIVKWTEARGNNFLGSVEFTKELDEEQLNKLRIKYNFSKNRTNRSRVKDTSGNVNDYSEGTLPAAIPKKHFTWGSFKIVALNSFLFFLIFSLLFLIGRNYFDNNSSNEENQKIALGVHHKKASTNIDPTGTLSGQFIASADAHSIVQNGTALSTENNASIKVLEAEGGSLYVMALKHYRKANETMFDLILQANPHITDVRQIYDDQKINLPALTSKSYVHKLSDGKYIVHVGTFDTMDVATFYADKVLHLKKQLHVQPHHFSPRDTWYRVTIDDFKTEKEALKTVSLLKDQGIIYIPSAVN